VKNVFKTWKPLFPAIQCGQKLVSLWPHCSKFLELCSTQFDIGF
jgi:hypothetical protein